MPAEMRSKVVKSTGQEAAEDHISVTREAGGPFVAAADRTLMSMLFTDPNLPGNPIIYVNDSFLSMSGYTREEVLGHDCYFMMGAETDPEARAQIDASFSGGFYNGHPEVRYYHKDGSSFWAIIFQGPALDAAGNVTHHFVSFIDVTGRRREERHLRLLLSELNHRTQNILATVQAIALQTLHDGADRNAIESFEDRVLALSAAHRLLGSANWEGADLREVIAAILVPFGFNDGQVERFSITGEDVFLPPKTALTFAMLFQELATNAAKYGALLDIAGHVDISWQVTPSARGERLRLRWAESGGPPVSPPRHKGFGSQLIEEGLAKELKGEVRLDYEAGGVVCQIGMPCPSQDRKERTDG
jgi:PAS domain S-box-containing protein